MPIDQQIRNERKVAEVWGKKPPEADRSFYLFPPLRDYFHRCLTGQTVETERDWYEAWVIETYLNDLVPVSECLSLCCGFGEIERILAGRNVFKHCVALDISPGAVERARATAREKGFDNIDYDVADLNTLSLEEEKYDVIWSIGALHHIKELEHLVTQIKRALKPGGYLIANEYVGPNHQQLPPRQLEIVNAVIHLIPQRLRDRYEGNFIPTALRRSAWKQRWFRLRRGQLTPYNAKRSSLKRLIFPLYSLVERTMTSLIAAKPEHFQYGKVYDNDPWYYQHVDPSEGVRASEILSVVEQTFSDVEVRHYNGSILHYALDRKFYEEYDPDSPQDRELLDLLIRIEEAMIHVGELESESAHIVARKE